MFGLSEEQKKRQNSSHRNKKHLVSSSTAKLSSSQIWLDQNYPKESRSQINSLEISGKGLKGLLSLVDFTNLEELYCYDNQLTGIEFATSSFDKLRVLHVGNNSFCERDLGLFSHLSELEVLNLRNNNFRGDLRVLKDLVNLRSLDISDTNIGGGLIYLSEKLESLFCQVEKESECQKIKEALKDYDLGNDCYDFQSWWKDENWLVIPGSWPKNKVDKVSEISVREEAFRKKEKFFELVNNIYQVLILNESEEKEAVSLFEFEKELEEFWKIAKEMKKGKEFFVFDNLKEQFEFDPCNLVLIAERYVSDNKKIKTLEGRIKELEQKNDLLVEKNEFWRLLQLELTKQNNEDNCWKSEEQEIAKMDEFKEFEIVKFNDDNDDRKKTYKHINININNIMTNTGNNKIFILEWESAELKDQTMRCENFKVITGSEKENLLFYSTFFSENNFKKGEIYQLVTPGNFVEDTSGNIPGSFNASGIIQGIDSGGYEFEKFPTALLIRELSEEKQKKTREIELAEKDLVEKKKLVERVNNDLLNAEEKSIQLRKQLDNLRSEKEERDRKIIDLEGELKKEKAEVEKANQKLVEEKSNFFDLQEKFKKLQFEKNEIENSWVNPERQEEDKKKIEGLKSESKIKDSRERKLTNELEEIKSREWRVVIEKKLGEKEKNLNQLKLAADSKLESSQKLFLEMLLVTQEQINGLVFEGVDPKICLPMKNQLQQHRGKLIPKLDEKEIDALCLAKTEVVKLQSQLSQWDKLEKIQLQEEYIEVPPK
ncbi:MAG: hypothetical protein I3270_00095 [Candidatus Moeniiplasma glomeromycotorum]|nr:hypothetical protein [Candidatus Moeniiplasma glomeromycotorum]MCE8166045.1 hypothetical protein [Candidatus Moeniiplasma glomeromycotorum]